MMDFIRLQHPFDYLSDAEFEQVEQSIETVEYQPGAYALSQGGDSSRYLSMIYRGRVRLERDGQITQTLAPGECFGYPSLISRTPPTADVITAEKTTVIRIPNRVFSSLLDNAQFSEFFLKNLGDRLRRITSRNASTMGGELTTPIGKLVVRPPVMVDITATVAQTAQKMRQAWVDVALIQADVPGIITDHDFQVKVLAEELGPHTPVSAVMTRPMKTLPAETPVHGALLFMLEENIHHVPITREGEIVGIVTASDLLRHQTRSPLYLMRQLDNHDLSETLSRYTVEIAGMVENLFNGGLDVAQIGRVIASINDALIRRLLRLAEERLGPPPTPYAWLVFGSEGRMEQALITDQDNALVYQTDSPAAREYFSTLATQVVNDLIKAGFPPCPGGYMAINWTKPMADWLKLFSGWINTPSPQALLETGIFFDFRGVHGQLSLEPLEQVVANSGKQSVFLGHMARAAMEFRPPIGFFRRIKTEDGLVDLKSTGIAPIVSLARVYALEGNIRVRSTIPRMEAAVAAGTLSQDGADTLIENYKFLLHLRLQEQLSALRAGKPADNKIRLQAVSALENRRLKDAFLSIKEMQDAAAQRFHTDLMG
jgi:CBS domain-containing protein